jgi:glycerol-3-phosphate dehydrogenase
MLVQPDAAGVTTTEVDAFITEVNEAFPALRLTRDDVTLVHRGVVPAAQDGRVPPALLSTPIVYDHAADGADGAMTVIGVKYTTARRVAQTVTERVAKRLGKRLSPSRTATTVLPGAGIADHEALAIETARACALELRVATIRHLIGLYAERTADIVRLMHERPDLQAPVSPAVSTLGAEVVHSIRHEMAVRLSDVVIRRTGLGAAGPPEDAALRRCAEIAARELGWDIERAESELDAVRRFYIIPDA